MPCAKSGAKTMNKDNEQSNFHDSDCDPDYVPSSGSESGTESEGDDVSKACIFKSSNVDRHKSSSKIEVQSVKRKVHSGNNKGCEQRSKLSSGDREHGGLRSGGEVHIQCVENEVPSGSNIENEHGNEQRNDDDNVEQQIGECSIRVASRCPTVKYFDKLSSCYYCNTMHTHIQRHWDNKHKEEKEVLDIKLTKEKSVRVALITKLRNLGNHVHNVRVLREGQGELIVKYRTCREDVTAEDYLPCEFCLDYLLKGDLFRHRCKLQQNKRRGRVLTYSALLVPPPKGMSQVVFEVISSMKDGGVKLVAKTDSLICDYAAKLLAKKGVEKKPYVRERIRGVAKFLIEMRKQEGLETATLTDCIHPTRFRACLIGVKSLAGYDEKGMCYAKPSLALKIGHALRKLSKIVKRNGIEQIDRNAIESADYFSELCSLEWGDEVSAHALTTLRDRKRNKLNLLPVSSDVVKINSYLNKSISESTVKLQQELTSCGKELLWRELAESTLAHIIIFNRRRQGEVSKMKIGDYSKRTMVNLNSDAVAGLSPVEKHLCKMFMRVEIVGKRDKTVPILLAKQVQSSLAVLMKYREAGGIRQSNDFVFAYPHSDNHLRGCDVLRVAAESCGAEHPSTLRSTNFRKHVATLSQVVNMKNNELDMLAQYMGHDIHIHRQFYRLPNDVLQTSKIAKLLLAMDKGQLGGQPGKSLDELIVNLEEPGGGVAVELSDVEPDDDDPVPHQTTTTSDELNEQNEVEPGSSQTVDSDTDDCDIDAKRAKRTCDSGDMIVSNSKKRKRPVQKKAWSEEEQDAVRRRLHSFIIVKKLPGKASIEDCLRNEPCLATRSWQNVKDFVRNTFLKN